MTIIYDPVAFKSDSYGQILSAQEGLRLTFAVRVAAQVNTS